MWWEPVQITDRITAGPPRIFQGGPAALLLSIALLLLFWGCALGGAFALLLLPACFALRTHLVHRLLLIRRQDCANLFPAAGADLMKLRATILAAERVVLHQSRHLLLP